MEKLKQAIAIIFYSSRAKSLYWRLGTQVVVHLANVLPDLGLDSWIVTFIGLILAEITKYLNKKKDITSE